jgi:hypothetical protein
VPLKNTFRTPDLGVLPARLEVRENASFMRDSGRSSQSYWCLGLHRLFFPVRRDSITNGDPLQALFSIFFWTPHGPTNRRRFELGQRQSPRTGNLFALAVWQHFRLPTARFPLLSHPTRHLFLLLRHALALALDAFCFTAEQ